MRGDDPGLDPGTLAAAARVPVAGMPHRTVEHVEEVDRSVVIVPGSLGRHAAIAERQHPRDRLDRVDRRHERFISALVVPPVYPDHRPQRAE
jgi:hypothetical protein